MIHKLQRICFCLSSLFKALGKFISPNKSIVVDSLSLPGWFIIDDYIIHLVPYKGKILGFDWVYYSMPDEWIKEMKKLKKRLS